MRGLIVTIFMDKTSIQICKSSIRNSNYIPRSSFALNESNSLFSIFDEFWGTCIDDKICFPGDSLSLSLSKYVGEKTVKNLKTGCNCPNGSYGPFCTSGWNEPAEKNAEGKKYCENGTHNPENFLTGCDCRNDKGEIIPFHGWYCEHHNSILCSESKPFYYVRSPLTIVGDTSGKCTRCTSVIPGCTQCKQDDLTNCQCNNY